MLLVTASPTPSSGDKPSRYAGVRAFPAPPPRPSRGGDGAEPHAVVHIVRFDAPAADRLSQLCSAAGVEPRVYPDVAAFSAAPLPDAPACMLVQLRDPRTCEVEFLARFGHSEAGLPMIVAAERADVRTAVLAMKAGATEFFERLPLDRELLEAVATAIAIDRSRRRRVMDCADLKARYACLTERERQVMELVTQGLLNKQVGGELGISEITVKAHRGVAMRKMGARTLADLVRMADALAYLAETQEPRSWR
jgi:FixJ family two-component response regulator